MVPKVRVSATATPSGPTRRTQATTVFLCTSSPAQRAMRTSIGVPPVGGRGPRGDPEAWSSLLCVLPGGRGGDRVGSDVGRAEVGPSSFSGLMHQAKTGLGPGVRSPQRNRRLTPFSWGGATFLKVMAVRSARSDGDWVRSVVRPGLLASFVAGPGSGFAIAAGMTCRCPKRREAKDVASKFGSFAAARPVAGARVPWRRPGTDDGIGLLTGCRRRPAC